MTERAPCVCKRSKETGWRMPKVSPAGICKKCGRPRNRRGFGSLPAEDKAAISRLGGKTAAARGVGHRFDSEEARIAGAKGGRPKPPPRRRGGSS